MEEHQYNWSKKDEFWYWIDRGFRRACSPIRGQFRWSTQEQYREFALAEKKAKNEQEA